MSPCPKCHSETYPGDKYCGQCGHKLVSSSHMRGGEMTQKSMKAADVRYKLGMVYFKRGKYEEAIKSWQKLLEDESENEAVKQLIDEARRKLKRIDG